MVIVFAYLVYLGISIGLTLWVGRALSSNGEVFLLDVFAEQATLAQAVNRLLLVGFYLLNLGYVAFALRIAGDVPDARAAIESLAPKLGGVLLVLGGLHLGNVFVLTRVRRRRLLDRESRPPLPPTGYTVVAPLPDAPQPA